MLYPLSPADKCGVESVGMTLAYSIDRSHATEPLDPMAVDRAARRMVERWRMLSGRLEWDTQREIWCLRIPDDELFPSDYATHTFTHSTSSYSYAIETPSSTTASVLRRPPMSLFRDPSTPCHSANYAKRIHPLVSIHVTTLSKHPNVVLLGITVPHTLVDATGMGLIAKALDAELGGWAWTVPPLPLPDAPNPYSEATAKVLEEIKDEPPKETSLALRRDYVDATVWTRAVFIANVVWEYTWHRSELRVITLGADVVRKIVEPAKQEVKAMTDGREYVSTGDILVAWLLKSVYGASSSKNLVSSCTVLSTRPLLPSLGVYPHNALVLSALPSVSIPALPTTPISALALLHRRQLIADRVPSILGEVHKYGDVVPRRDRGTDYWFHSNQIVAEITSFCSLGPLLGYWPYTMPGTLDHSTTFNELGDGYTILISMRRSRWKTMKKVLRKLEAEVQLEVDEGFFEKGQLSPSRGNYV